MTRRFEQLESYQHEDVEMALKRDEADELRNVVVAVALQDADYDFADRLCVQLARHRNSLVRGNALLGFGHIARRFGKASEEGRALVGAGRNDRDTYVRGHSESAADDIAMFAL